MPTQSQGVTSGFNQTRPVGYQLSQPNKTSGLPGQPTHLPYTGVSPTHTVYTILCVQVYHKSHHIGTPTAAVCLHVKYTHTHTRTHVHTHTHTHMCIRYEGELCTYSKFRHTYIQTHVCAVNEQKLNTHIWTAASHSKLTTLQGALHRKQLSLIQDREYMRTYVRVYACPGLPRQQVKLPTKMSVSQW